MSEERLVTLRRLVEIGERLVALAEKQPLDDDVFGELLQERLERLEWLVNGAEQDPPEDAADYDEMVRLTEQISELDKRLVEKINQETAALKQQISAQMERRKGLQTYGVNVLAHKNVLLDEEG